MKNTKKIIKTSIALVMVLMLCSATAVPAFAATASTPSIFNGTFDPGNVIKTIINWIVGILALAGVIVGAVQIVLGGFINDDPKQRNTGIITLLISLAVGVLILTVTNMILA